MESTMKSNRNRLVALFAAALLTCSAIAPVWAAPERTEVVGEVDIQGRIDQRIDREAADRQAIADLLRRPDVRRIAGTAGIDIERVTTAAGMLSGSELATVAASAKEIDAQAGGAEKVTVAVTTIIIVLLLILLIA
jgi:hypothetical protein